MTVSCVVGRGPHHQKLSVNYCWFTDWASTHDVTTVSQILCGRMVGMIARMQGKRNPEVIIQSATLNPLFERGDAIKTQMEMTAKGIIVTQTSTDPEVVQLLQTHAAEVSDLAARGMAAVHERMQGQHHR